MGAHPRLTASRTNTLPAAHTGHPTVCLRRASCHGASCHGVLPWRLAMASCHGGLRPRRPASRDTARSMDAAGAARSEDYHGLRDARGAGPDVWGSRALRQKTRERAPAPARLRNRAGLLLAAGSCPPLVNPGRDGEVGRAVALPSVNRGGGVPSNGDGRPRRSLQDEQAGGRSGKKGPRPQSAIPPPPPPALPGRSDLLSLQTCRRDLGRGPGPPTRAPRRPSPRTADGAGAARRAPRRARDVRLEPWTTTCGRASRHVLLLDWLRPTSMCAHVSLHHVTRAATRPPPPPGPDDELFFSSAAARGGACGRAHRRPSRETPAPGRAAGRRRRPVAPRA